MNIYDRIKTVRQQKEISQDELARLTGYKSRSSINKIEAGLVDIPLSKVFQFATALHVTPQYLLGWAKQSEMEVTPHESNLIKKYRALDERGKQAVDDTLDREYEFVKPKAEESAIS